jgi:hypothetical protein
MEIRYREAPIYTAEKVIIKDSTFTKRKYSYKIYRTFSSKFFTLHKRKYKALSYIVGMYETKRSDLFRELLNSSVSSRFLWIRYC